MFKNWPFTNLYDLNLDWIIEQLKLVKTEIEKVPEDIKDAYTPTNPPPYPVTSVDGETGDVEIDFPVTSVEGKTGDVTLDYPVTSVQGRTGDVTLVGHDITALNLGIVAYTTGYGTIEEQGISATQLTAWWNSGIRILVLSSSQTIENDLIYMLSLTNSVVTYKLLTTGGEVAAEAYSPTNPPPYPVTSVNDETGDVTIDIPLPYRETFAITDTTASSWDFMDANITDSMVVLESVIDVPGNVSTDLTVTTSDGSLNVSGTVTGAVNLTLTLMETSEG